ncbi:hypothetical protein [Actinokineospora xionganensis]|uniref:Cytochrome P450 n=1 Tax=Actinokineospora xionganensis TaxID=2684470 RepID=A0ABR7LBL7_9PSEU|nr:hypothetical protein [Actinokineospora xionganensis]MBC6449692.1 hypothetical protein [Actinokineospora xionganensis]
MRKSTDGTWLVDRPADAAVALDALSVAGPSGLVGRMPRFSDGARHARGRAQVEAVLPEVSGLRSAAAARTGTPRGEFDLMPIALDVPVAVLAAALGVEEVAAAVRLTRELCESRSDEAYLPLAALLPDPAAVSVLFQAHDATAALIAAAVLEGGVEQAVRSAPVHRTQRRTVANTAIGGVVLPPGSALWVSLAETGTFGAGRHACPGSALATTLAQGVLDALGEVGVVDVEYEPRPNLRLPARLIVRTR